MAFRMEFNTNNEAFTDSTPEEIARILNETADKIRNGQYEGRVRDINGNRIGVYGGF